jgi:hypothetical protein
VDGANEKKVVNLVETEVWGVQREIEIATSECDAIAKPAVEPRTGTIYAISIVLAVDLVSVKGEEIAEVLDGLRDDSDYVVELLKNSEIELVDVFPETPGYVLAFETYNEEVANKFGFPEMLRPDAEDFEPTPWTVQS